MGTPVLVDSDWLEAVDAFVRSRTEAPLPAPSDAGSRFYDVRPARLVRDWNLTTIDRVQVWRATANFIVNNVVDKSSKIDVYAPLAIYSQDQPTPAKENIFVVWRGRWELLAYFPETRYYSAGGIQINQIDRTIKNAGVTSIYVGDSPTPPSAGVIGTITGAVCFDERHFVASAFGSDAIGALHGIALRNPPITYRFSAGDGIEVVEAGSSVTITNTSPNKYPQYFVKPNGPQGNLEIVELYQSAGEKLGYVESVHNILRFHPLTLAQVPLDVITDVKLNYTTDKNGVKNYYLTTEKRRAGVLSNEAPY